ncbi:hypothetical protein T440DRAFT_140774 [Plenodomus tracheiphilus IPT5]|uniref:Uncharacterized protein n=1 Tax=Plenodomus tracheiphilus IPT5 TaxID=1408161 RepID=A0A6A7B1T1_9PLEO|nr:hypothetical protein T440DRAFT_140774 [Plenodomus tracheiphilus IPT5]
MLSWFANPSLAQKKENPEYFPNLQCASYTLALLYTTTQHTTLLSHVFHPHQSLAQRLASRLAPRTLKKPLLSHIFFQLSAQPPTHPQPRSLLNPSPPVPCTHIASSLMLTLNQSTTRVENKNAPTRQKEKKKSWRAEVAMHMTRYKARLDLFLDHLRLRVRLCIA